MLTEVRIRNFAIIDALTLPLEAGLNVLSGETGAGKSIIVGALAFLLGERASGDLVRPGSDRAVIEGVFDTGETSSLADVLDARGIDVSGGTAVLRREITSAGRTRAWVNGTTVTATAIGEIGRLLVSLHGQHEAQTLLDSASQRRVLDAFAGAGDAAERVRAGFERLAAIRAEIETLRDRAAEATRRADYLRHVVREIEQARLVASEEERVEDDARRLEHAEELQALATNIETILDGEEASVLSQLAAVERALQALVRIDPSLAPFRESYDGAFYALGDLARAAGAYAESVERDPTRLQELNRRRELIFGLKKKYGATVAEVIQTFQRAKAELDFADAVGGDLRAMETREREQGAALAADAERLSGLRRAAATRLAAAVDARLPAIGMPGGHLSVAFGARESIAATGAEEVEFRVTLNVGHDPRPLAKVASGGELSRVMLALNTILATLEGVPTLVFDEVDAGIGGQVAVLVGDALAEVAATRQVLVISHLPQIAARAAHHVRVSKRPRAGVTTADIEVLDGEARVEEVARMLGGDARSEASRRHAEEMLRAPATAPRAPRAPRAQRARRRGA